MQTDIVLDIFRKELEKQGMRIESIDDEGLIHVLVGDLTLKISLENARRNYERDSDESHILDLVNTIVSYSLELPDWENAKRDVYISLFPNDFDFKEFVNNKITDDFSKVYVHSAEGNLTWLTANDIEKWGVTEQELDLQANNNAQAMLEETLIGIHLIEDRKLGSIDTEDETLKGALLFAPNMKEKVSKDFGFPFFAVIPVRDFCYIFSEKDFDFFAARLGSTVVKEYKESGYPITTEILKFTDQGVEAVGKYPVD